MPIFRTLLRKDGYWSDQLLLACRVHCQHMRTGSVLLAAILATLTWQIAAFEPQAGPWVVWHPDGSCLVAVEVADGDLQEVSLQTPDSSDIRLLSWQKVQRDFTGTTWIASGVVESSAPREWSLFWGQQQALTVLLPEPPSLDQASAVVVATPAHYPTKGDLALIAEELGQPVELVVLLGAGSARSLGRGGWEATTAVAIVPPHHHDTALLDQVAGPGASWYDGLSWGRLGLPAGQGQYAAAVGDHLGLTLARDLSPWQVALDPKGWWSLDVASADRGVPTDILEMVRRRRVPLVVSASSTQGFLSDPLSLSTAREVIAIPGGTRWLGLANGAADVAGLPATIAYFQPRPTIVGLGVDHDLTVLQVQSGEGVDWQIRYPPWPEPEIPALPLQAPAHLVVALKDWRFSAAANTDEPRVASFLPIRTMDDWRDEGGVLRELGRSLLTDRVLAVELDAHMQVDYPWPQGGVSDGSGWGLGDVQTGAQQWLAGADLQDQSHLSASWPWLAQSQLKLLVREGVSIESVFARYQESPILSGLLSRMAGIEPTIVMSWMTNDLTVPANVARDALLRQIDMGLERVNMAVFGHAIEVLDDPVVIRAILARVEQQPQPRLLDVLMRHWQRIAMGDALLPTDTILQHRLATAVFDSPFLSPTPLRPLAVALRERLDPAAAGPVQRFLRRHGETRPLHR